MKTIMKTIERMASHKNSNLGPGEAYRIPDAADVGECVPQGDLYLSIASGIPEGYHRVEQPTNLDRQLVPGTTTGSRHCLERLDTVDLYWPTGWSHSLAYEGLAGPAFVCREDTDVLHPTHGTVTCPAGRVIVCGYQRVYDDELKRERRAQD